MEKLKHPMSIFLVITGILTSTYNWEDSENDLEQKIKNSRMNEQQKESIGNSEIEKLSHADTEAETKKCLKFGNDLGLYEECYPCMKKWTLQNALKTLSPVTENRDLDCANRLSSNFIPEKEHDSLKSWDNLEICENLEYNLFDRQRLNSNATADVHINIESSLSGIFPDSDVSHANDNPRESQDMSIDIKSINQQHADQNILELLDIIKEWTEYSELCPIDTSKFTIKEPLAQSNYTEQTTSSFETKMPELNLETNPEPPPESNLESTPEPDPELNLEYNLGLTPEYNLSPTPELMLEPNDLKYGNIHPVMISANSIYHQNFFYLNRGIISRLVEIDPGFLHISPLFNRFRNTDNMIRFQSIYLPFIYDNEKKLNISFVIQKVEEKYDEDKKREIDLEFSKFCDKVSAVTSSYSPLPKEHISSSGLYEAIRTQKLFEELVLLEVNKLSKFFVEELKYEEKLVVYKIEKEMIAFAKKCSQDALINGLFPEIGAIFYIYYENYDKHTLKDRWVYGGTYLFSFMTEKFDLLKKHHADLEKNPLYFAKLILLIRLEYVLDLLRFMNICSYHLMGYLLLCLKSYYERANGILNESVEMMFFEGYFKIDALKIWSSLVKITPKSSV